MSRRLVNLTLDNLDDVAMPCRACVFWERDPAGERKVRDEAEAGLIKEAWVSDTLLEWGCCGQLVYVDGVPAGHVLYAPPAYVPRAMSFATSPVAGDAVLLMSAHVRPDFAGGGLGRMLVQGLARDVTRRGIRAVEVFGRSTVATSTCLPPVDYLRSVGFKTVRPHPLTPRLRLDIRSIVAWKEDVESAIERLLGTIAVPALGARRVENPL
jgi:N-acetylglutamate synthase-like GNAT family acetyltransferase